MYTTQQTQYAANIGREAKANEEGDAKAKRDGDSGESEGGETARLWVGVFIDGLGLGGCVLEPYGIAICLFETIDNAEVVFVVCFDFLCKVCCS